MQKTVLILHGWGLYGKKYAAIENILVKKGFRVLSPDFPGFGSMPLRNDAMSVSDYVAFVKSYLDTHHSKKVDIIGHSFGGRVAAKFAATYPTYVDKLLLTGSPLIKTKLTFRKQTIAFFVKKGKKLFQYLPENLYKQMRWILYRSLGEWDYYKSQKLKETFIKINAEDLAGILPNIHAKTLVIWGETDSFVPLRIGKQIAQTIPAARLEIIKAQGHGVPYTAPEQFAKLAISFFEK